MSGGRSKVLPDDNEFEAELRKLGPTALHRKYGLSQRAIYLRRANLERKNSRPITYENPYHSQHRSGIFRQEEFPGRLNINVTEGVVIVAGDAHYWPGKPSLMHRALIHFVRKYADEKVLRAVVMNGDVTDFPRLSQWPNVDWQKRPSIKDEIEVCTDRLHEIEMASGKAERVWTLGNHDARWSIYLARHSPEIEGVKGINLKDHFPNWRAAMSLMINPDFGPGTTFVKHIGPSTANRTAALLNVEKTGCSIVTNHLHNAQVVHHNDIRPWTYYGVDTGCIADVYGPQFMYLQDNRRNWRSAFAILKYRDGKLMLPELVLGWDEKRVQFRHELIKPA